MANQDCPTCHGARLSENVLAVKIGGKNIYEICLMSIKELIPFFNNTKIKRKPKTNKRPYR
jgi:Excinuclease ABC subunit A